MTETEAIQTLTAWFSPAYPVGAYSYSHGLEWAIEAGDVTDAPGLGAWVADVLRFGAGRTDTMLLAAAWRGADVAALAEALTPSLERHLETTAQGAAFARTTAAAYGIALAPAAYPVAVGQAAAALGLPLRLTAVLYVQAFAASLVSAGIRLVPLGQTDGQRLTASLLPLAETLADAALAADPADLGGLAFRADLAAMRHETQYSRLYRS